MFTSQNRIEHRGLYSESSYGEPVVSKESMDFFVIFSSMKLMITLIPSPIWKLLLGAVQPMAAVSEVVLQILNFLTFFFINVTALNLKL